MKNWGDDKLKSLLKNQFYKSLNGGMPDFAEDNIKRSASKLEIGEREKPVFYDFFHLVFTKMKVLSY